MALILPKKRRYYVGFRASAVQSGSGSDVTIPSSAKKNDIAILFQVGVTSGGGSGTPAAVTPAGWTNLRDSTVGNGRRYMIDYKVLSDSDAGVTATGMTSNHVSAGKIMLVFSRGGYPTSSVTLGSPDAEARTGDPPGVTSLSSGYSVPIIAFGFCWNSNTTPVSSFTATSPDFDAEVTGAGNLRVGYRAQNVTPADQTVNMGDDGTGSNVNVLMAGLLVLA